MQRSGLSIIIPTLNEEYYIGKLLDSIAKQTVLPDEIVVVDAESKDKTIDEIKKRQIKLKQLRYFQIPKYTIGRQRNLGVKKTKSSNILFLDADVELRDSQTLEKFLTETKKRNPDVATAEFLPSSENIIDKLFFKGWNLSYKALKPVWPMANTINFYVKRSIFNKHHGFNEEIAIGEDHELLQRIVNKGGIFIFLRKPKVYHSVRRIEKEGRWYFTYKVVRNLMLLQYKDYTDIPNDYEFGKFSKES